jgi:alpha-L-fucosidase 2
MVAENGQTLKPAKGKNTNKFFKVEKVASPVISKEAKLNKPQIPETFVYDVQTEPGGIYVFTGN